METTAAPPAYQERLWPAPWIYLATALVIPASLLVFLPISVAVGVAIAAVLYAAILIVLFATTPRIEVANGVLTAGRAHVPLRFVSGASAHLGEEAFAERGVRLDARAWLLLRGWVSPVVRVELDDPDDPTPYWLISTRRPDALVAAVGSQRTGS